MTNTAISAGKPPALGAETGLSRGTFGALFVTILAWASAFPAIRAGLTGFGPVELGAARFAIAALPAALFLIATRPALPKLGEIWRFATGGLFFVFLYTILLNIGEQTVSAGPASFIINVNPIITALFAIVFLSERFGKWAWAGTFLSFAGIGLIALGEGSEMKIDLGALLILGSAFCNSISTIVQKPLFQRHRPLTVSAWNMIIGAVLLAPALPGVLEQAPLATNEAIWSAVYLGIVPSLVAYGTWAIVLSKMPASRASNFMYCVPPVATLIGFLWLGETPSLLGIVGGVLALGGVALVNLKK
ncbi:MAG: DMT family transporter [Proteobacteria bacterium]|nr:DMT family transporter [Pseudomonadota bacterium]